MARTTDYRSNVTNSALGFRSGLSAKIEGESHLAASKMVTLAAEKQAIFKLLGDLVDLVGIEPTTSPAKPGRAQSGRFSPLINS
jgi:hypothetical protein